MSYTGYELLWLFIVYSFAGWVLETIFAAAKQKHFVNRGLINGPFCVTYGFSEVLMTVGLHGLGGLWLFGGAVIYGTVMEWIAGHLIEKYYHERWWDYSGMRWNLDGYIALRMSLLWGVLGYVSVRWGNVLLTGFYRLLPSYVGGLVLWIFAGIVAVDALATYILIRGVSKRPERWEAADDQFANVARRLGMWIYGHVERRIHKAYRVTRQAAPELTGGIFAEGCGFYKLSLLFIAGALLGDLIETVFCRVRMGSWMSRSSVVWGPFSIVWGFALAGATALLYKYRDRSVLFLFGAGTLLGAAYEYFCSVFTELVFGTVFWNYSAIPFNLGGRINLLYSFFWGFVAVVWFKKLYPLVSGLIEKLPVLFGKVVTWGLLLFMVCNIAVSSMALIRYDERYRGVKAEKTWQVWMDENYGDGRMERIYPNARKVR